MNLDFLKISETDEDEDLELDYDINLDNGQDKKPKFRRVYDAKYKIPSA